MSATTLPEDDAAFGWWLSGFIDGEGCFRIQSGRANGVTPYYSCQFSLKQRDDDASLLTLICERTGIGRVRFDTVRSGNSKPCAIWCAETKLDTRALVEVVDRFPLQSRKAADYVIWREAVMFYAEQERGNRWHGQRDWSRMAEFKAALADGRLYSGRG